MTADGDEIRSLEETGFVAWPALETVRRGGWVMRSSVGTTRRANSVTPLDHGDAPLPEMIDLVEEWFAQRGLPAVFRIVDGLGEPHLDGELTTRGYSVVDPTDTLVLGTTPDVRPAPGVSVSRVLTEEWMESFATMVGLSGERLDAAQRLLAESPVPNAFAALREDGSIVAVGMCSLVDGRAGIFNMNTSVPHRRRGFAAAVLDGLIGFAAGGGASLAWLQVTVANRPAQTLYRRRGFVPFSRYHYRIR